MNSLVIGSRGSPLALAQSNSIAEKIRSLHPGLEVVVKVIRTTGDKFSTSSLSALAEDTKGLFVKEIEEALLAGSIDLAVHSLKDVPTELPIGLSLGVMPEREEPWDALVSEYPISSLDELPSGFRVGTSSLRRKIQLASQRPDLEVLPVRGNIDTRIRKLQEQPYDGMILAAAGLARLELSDLITYRFPVDEMVPAIGQGCLALEIRERDNPILELVRDLDDEATKECVTAERVFLEKMGGGCQLPLGAYAVMEKNHSKFYAFLASPSGSPTIKQSFVGSISGFKELVDEAVDSFKSQGGDRLLRKPDN